MEGPGGGTPYNDLYGEAPPERGTFFRIWVYETERGRNFISEVYERLGISIFSVNKKAQADNRFVLRL